MLEGRILIPFFDRCLPVHMVRRYSGWLLLMMLMASCAKGDKVPAYLEIPGFSLSTTTEQGLATSRITEAWVSVDESFIGVWELPARVPVLAEGAHRIDVVPGVKRNGLFDDRLQYPFYTTSTSTAMLTKEGTTTLSPAIVYRDNTNIWLEGFEDTFVRLNTTDASDTTLLRISPAEEPGLLFLQNTPCGAFRLDAAHPYVKAYSDEDFEVSGGPVFLELDYRNDLLFTVGAIVNVEGTETTVPLVLLVPTRRSDGSMPWNKVYIDLSSVFNAGVTQRDIFFEASLPSGSTSAEIYLDNIKLVRFGS